MVSEAAPSKDRTLDARDARSTELAAGAPVGRYVILARLGRGGMGVVYRAYDPELDRHVALKLLKSSDPWASAQRDRLMREAQALARVQHPNVIAVYDVGTHEGDVFLAMELVEGVSLHVWLRDKARSIADVLAVFLAAGEGLVAAHLADLVHRDFKPENVMIGVDGRVRVLDFGLARMAPSLSEPPPRPTPVPPSMEELNEPTLDEHPRGGEPVAVAAARSAPSSRSARSGNLLATPLTIAEAIVGTPRYMSPEQVLGTGIDARSDQFSFCVALYQALYTAYPFAGAPQDEERDWRVVPPPEGSRVPRWLRAVLLKGLSEKAADRYATMTDLLIALRADPWARRRRWLQVGAGLVAVSGLVAGAAWAERRHSRVCAGAERELEGIWDEPRQEQVAAAFRKSGLPYADTALTTVRKALADYARAWTGMHVEACERTVLRGDQSQELLDLRMACLRDRRTELKTISDLFVLADPGVVEHAAQSAQSLPSVALCADVAALRATTPPPRDPAALARVTAVRGEVARAQALEVAARFARTALGEARSLGYEPAITEAEVTVGEIQGDQGAYADAARTLEDAYVSALGGKDDTAAARAAKDLILAQGARQAHYDDGERWANVALALAGRLAQKDQLLGEVYSERSNLREREGKYEDALKDATQALDLELRAFGADDFRVASVYYHLGAIHYYRAEHAEALEAYRKSLDILGRTSGPDHPALLGARVGIADVYGDSGDHKRALAEYESALATMQRVRPNDPDLPMIRNNMGGELQQLGRPAEAFAQYKLAFDDWHARIGPGKEAITALSNMGEAKNAMSQPDEARRYYDQGLAMCRVTLGVEHHDCARLLWGVGESYRLMGKPSEAMDAYERSLALTEKALGPEHPQLTGPLLGMARIDVLRSAPAKAKVALDRLLSILGDEPGEGLTAPDARFLLAQAHWAMGERVHAGELAAKAREGYEAAGEAGREGVREVDAWRASHR
jgi:serine/threonine protein kinase/tetratricopeptide (TPR) repeat protein